MVTVKFLTAVQFDLKYPYFHNRLEYVDNSIIVEFQLNVRWYKILLVKIGFINYHNPFLQTLEFGLKTVMNFLGVIFGGSERVSRQPCIIITINKFKIYASVFCCLRPYLNKYNAKLERFFDVTWRDVYCIFVFVLFY